MRVNDDDVVYNLLKENFISGNDDHSDNDRAQRHETEVTFKTLV